MKRSLVDQDYFFRLASSIFASLAKEEFVSFELVGEESTFLRFNSGKVRQAGELSDCLLNMRYVHFPAGEMGRTIQSAFTLSAVFDRDIAEAKNQLAWLRDEVKHLPPDPFVEKPDVVEESVAIDLRDLPSPPDAVDRICQISRGLEFTGNYTAGLITRALANSGGTRHWFCKNNFFLDYSIHGEGERALKSVFSQKNWSEEALANEFAAAREKFALLSAPPVAVKRGAYRTFLAPAAVADLLRRMSDSASEMAIRQGDSPFRKLRNGSAQFSQKFSLAQDFSQGDAPRFDVQGRLAPEKTILIESGKLRETLVGPRTAKEFGIQANGASNDEKFNCPSMASGDLSQAQTLSALGEGLYLSNLHYLNWSDRPEGRITGMTRFACFWVENGRLKAPIQNLRWDDSIFRFFGSELEAVGDEVAEFPETSAYFFRSVGAVRNPGVLLSSMQFTL